MKKIGLFFLFFMLILLLASKTDAREILDAQKICIERKKPVAKFKVANARTKEEVYSNFRLYDRDLYQFDLAPPVLKAVLGDTIELYDYSVEGAGSRVVEWDLQINPPIGKNDAKVHILKSEVERKITLNQVGIWRIYLCVKDNASLINGVENWSVNGNHSSLGEFKTQKDLYIWWYFTELDIEVSEVDQKEEPKQEQPVEEAPVEEWKNHSPETEIFIPDKLYSEEITAGGDYRNVLSFDYYDVDRDPVKDAGYTLYRKNAGQYEKVKEGSGLIKGSDRQVELTGRAGETFRLEVYVTDRFDAKGYDTKTFKIGSFKPEFILKVKERSYWGKEIKIECDELGEFFPNRYLGIEYVGWEITDEDKKVIAFGDTRIPENILLDLNTYAEGRTYRISQTVKNANHEYKTVAKNFYVVPVAAPQISLSNIKGYYGKTYDTKIKITQPQTDEQGDLTPYETIFNETNCGYEVYDRENRLISRKLGIVQSITLDESIGIQNEEEQRSYRIVQYAQNGVGKKAKAEALIVVEKPQEASVELKIMERDQDPGTIPNEIYQNESLLLEVTIEEGNQKITGEWFEIENNKGAVLYKSDGRCNGLLKMDYATGEYYITQYVRTEDGRQIYDSQKCIIHEINRPLIRIRDKETLGKSFYKDQKLIIEVSIKEINKSEEHPNGFELANHYQLIWEGKEKILERSGIVDQLNLLELGATGEYTLRQHSVNKEHNEIFEEELFKFEVLNKRPTLELGLEKEELFATEQTGLRIVAKDEDGYIQKLEILNKNSELLSEVDKVVIKSSEHEKEMRICYEGMQAGSATIEVIVTDDTDASTRENVTLKIKPSNIITRLSVVDEKKVVWKQDRFIQWNVRVYSEEEQLDLTKVDIEYKRDEEHFIRISDVNSYEDENIKLLFDEAPSRENFSMYFKEAGSYQFRARGVGSITAGEWDSKKVEIQKDVSPVADLKILATGIRQEDTKTAEIHILDLSYSEDDEIGEKRIEIAYRDKSNVIKIMDANSIESVFETFKNALGVYYIRMHIKEKAQNLPKEDHPFYAELLEKVKKESSDFRSIEIVNRAPQILYSTENKIYKVKYYFER